MSYPTITLEEHFLSDAIEKGHTLAQYKHFPTKIHDRLKDISPDGSRLQEMDAGQVSIQVISHAPGAASAAPALVAKANDELANAIKASPKGRLAGFAALPMGRPAEAAKELERCVKNLGFVGALIDNHLESGYGSGLYYDTPQFWPVFAKAEELDVPVYLHPTFATEDMMKLNYTSNVYPTQTAFGLSMAGWGWHQDTGLHFLRLFASGLFDKHPRLKLIIGHMGELLPFQLERIDGMVPSWGANNERSLQDVWRTNMYITTSGMFSVNPMACLIRNTPLDHILYSVDWPFSSNEQGVKFLEDLKASGMVKEDEIKAIAYGNAEKLLKVKAK